MSRNLIAAKKTPVEEKTWAAWDQFQGTDKVSDWRSFEGRAQGAAGSLSISDARDLNEAGEKLLRKIKKLDRQSRSWRMAYNLIGEREIDYIRMSKDLRKSRDAIAAIKGGFESALRSVEINDIEKEECQEAIEQAQTTLDAFDQAIEAALNEAAKKVAAMKTASMKTASSVRVALNHAIDQGPRVARAFYRWAKANRVAMQNTLSVDVDFKAQPREWGLFDDPHSRDYDEAVKDLMDLRPRDLGADRVRTVQENNGGFTVYVEYEDGSDANRKSRDLKERLKKWLLEQARDDEGVAALLYGIEDGKADGPVRIDLDPEVQIWT